jgi:magnesium transporter
MAEERREDPWKALELLIEDAQPEEVEAFLESLPAGETARTLARLSEEHREWVLSAISPAEAADLIEEIPAAQAADLIEQLPPGAAAEIVSELPSDAQADLLGDLEADSAEAILAEMDPADASEARSLSRHDDDVAGGLMVTEFLAFPQRSTVAEVIEIIRANAEQYGDYQVQYLYVTDPAGRLVGVLPLRNLLLARHNDPIGDLMIRDPLTVNVDATLAELEVFFDRYGFLGVPATDANGVLVGIVHRAAVEEARGERSESDFLRTQGIMSEELRTMPMWQRSRRRMAWLSVNILLNIVAASVIALYESTLAQVIALAVFLPIISDMSGCSGNQAVAVSMRELTLGLIKPGEVLRVWLQEILVGLVNGLGLGLLIAGAAWLWKGNLYLGAVVGVAMMVNTLIAVSIGGTLPLILKRLRVDPALASGPILTTVTDMCGFFLVLSLAALMLPYLLHL